MQKTGHFKEIINKDGQSARILSQRLDNIVRSYLIITDAKNKYREEIVLRAVGESLGKTFCGYVEMLRMAAR